MCATAATRKKAGPGAGAETCGERPPGRNEARAGSALAARALRAFAQNRARRFAARNHPVRLSASRPWLRHPAPPFCRPVTAAPRRVPNGKTTALVAIRLHFACGETALAGHRPHLLGLPRKIGRGVSPRETTRCGLSASRPWLRHPAPLFCRPVTAAPRRVPNGKTPALAPHRLHFACGETARQVTGPTGAVISALLPGTIVNRPGFLYNKRQDSYHT